MSVSGQLKDVFIPIIEEWWSNRQLGPAPAGNDYERLGDAIATLLEFPNLPADLREAINNHLTKMFADKRILAPDWCRRLYPLLAELNKPGEGLDAGAATAPAGVYANGVTNHADDHPISHTINGEVAEVTFQEVSSF